MKLIGLISVIVVAGVFLALSVCDPNVLADNEFLRRFLDDQVLNILAVIMTISITSIATIHIWFNELESKNGQRVFGPARREINQAAFWLIGIFLAEFVVLIIRSYCTNSVRALSIVDGIGVILVLASVITLLDIIGVIKALTALDD